QPVAPAAAKWVDSPLVRQMVSQPAQNVVLPSAPVATPEARRMHIHGGEPGRPAADGQANGQTGAQPGLQSAPRAVTVRPSPVPGAAVAPALPVPAVATPSPRPVPVPPAHVARPEGRAPAPAEQAREAAHEAREVREPREGRGERRGEGRER